MRYVEEEAHAAAPTAAQENPIESNRRRMYSLLA